MLNKGAQEKVVDAGPTLLTYAANHWDQSEYNLVGN